MDTKTITLNKTGLDGKPMVEQVTVAKFVEMYNIQNAVFTRTTDYSQTLLGQLYAENPENDFFKHCEPKLVEYAKKRAEEIKENPARGIVEKFVEPEEEPEEQPNNVTKPLPAPEKPKPNGDEPEEEKF